jgi:RNA polymerase sigma-70 factor (ECF subfamily)
MEKDDIITELVKAVPGGDEDAFRQLYEMTNRKVYNYLYRMVNNQHMAEDLLIETFTEVWKSARGFRAESKGLTWMIGIARHRAMNALRGNRNREDDIDDNIEDPPAQMNTCAASEAAVILETALNRLPPTHREVLDLIFFQGLVYEDVARVTGIPLNTVKTRVFYAKDKLKGILSSMGIAKDDLV